MGVNSLPKTVTRQRRDCDLNPGPSAPEYSTLTTRLPSHPTGLWPAWITHVNSEAVAQCEYKYNTADKMKQSTVDVGPYDEYLVTIANINANRFTIHCEEPNGRPAHKHL